MFGVLCRVFYIESKNYTQEIKRQTCQSCNKNSNTRKMNLERFNKNIFNQNISHQQLENSNTPAFEFCKPESSECLIIRQNLDQMLLLNKCIYLNAPWNVFLSLKYYNFVLPIDNVEYKYRNNAHAHTRLTPLLWFEKLKNNGRAPAPNKHLALWYCYCWQLLILGGGSNLSNKWWPENCENGRFPCSLQQLFYEIEHSHVQFFDNSVRSRLLCQVRSRGWVTLEFEFPDF